MKGFHHKERGVGVMFDDIYIVNGSRTPFGKYCGSLSTVSPTDLGIYAAKDALLKSGVNANDIDQLIAANIGQSSYDAYFLPRHVSLFAGLPIGVPALMVQRICGSGFETIITGAEQIALGKAATVLCVGTENMSLAPTVNFGGRMGYMLGRPVFKDMLWEALDDTAAGYPMGYTAENIAKRFNITRMDVDTFAKLSFDRALAAQERKYFSGEMCEVKPEVFEREGLKPRKVSLPRGVKSLNSDEHLRPTTIEALSKLPTVFKEVGVLTAGNSSGIVDGAAAVVIQRGKNSGNSIARLVAGASSGVDPKEMGLGPVPAIKLLLEISGLKLDDIGLFEINEAFGAQFMGCERELNLDREKVNVNGGAIAIGHPLAASGLRLTHTLAREMQARKVKYGIASACIGGGQGTAVLIENTNF